jgi:hypothetical protein
LFLFSRAGYAYLSRRMMMDFNAQFIARIRPNMDCYFLKSRSREVGVVNPGFRHSLSELCAAVITNHLYHPKDKPSEDVQSNQRPDA